MLLRGARFSPVWNASGARGFFGEGYWFHSFFKPLGLDYSGATFVAKTTTLEKRDGNMLLDERHRPVDLFPGCVRVKLFKGVALNSVGLSGPGIQALLPIWEGLSQQEPWFASIMSTATDAETRVQEIQSMVTQLGITRAAPALQVNLSCPNVGLDPDLLVAEAEQYLTETQRLEIPTVVKVNVTFPIEAAKEILKHPACDGLVVSNTIPWGKLPDRIDWKGLWGSTTSPLAHLGGGGLSGKPLLPLVQEWITSARQSGITKPLIGGGGVLSKKDAGVLLDAGASAIELGSIAFLRPWRVASIIRHVRSRFA